MSLIIWDEQYLLGIKEIDEQHKQLADCINQFHAAFVVDNNSMVFDEILNTLKKYIKTHFKYEQKLMKKFNYPETDEHIQEHESFKAKIIEIEKTYLATKSNPGADVLGFLIDWMLTHILEIDYRLTEYILNSSHSF